MNDDLQSFRVDHTDDVAIALSDQLPVDVAEKLARQIATRLAAAAVPSPHRTWIVASSGDDEAAANVASAIAEHVADATLLVHDPRAFDDLTFERRIPGQRRGGVYINAAWQSASVRIACGDPLQLVDGLSAWFNHPAQLRADDLDATRVF